MGASIKQDLCNQIWQLADPEEYDNLVELLMMAMTEEQLRDVIASLKS